MDVLSFVSEDKRITIQVATATDVRRLWPRFCARVGSTERARTYCEYSTSLIGTLSLAEPKTGILQCVGDDWQNLPPVFYETAVYNFSLRFVNVESAPIITHKLKEVTDLFTAVNVGSNEWLLAAPLDFLNEPGIFELSFRYKPVGGRERTDNLLFRVVSPKLDTKEDYNHILNDINCEYNEIVFKYLTKTFQNLSQGGRTKNDVIWLSIFREIVELYVKAVLYIIHRPHLQETHDVLYSRADRIKKWSPNMARRFHECKKGNVLESTYFRHEVVQASVNTRENQFVKYTLDRIISRLGSIFNNARSNMLGSKEIATLEVEELENYLKKLCKLSSGSLFRNIKGKPLRSESIVLQKRTGYAQVYRSWLMLQKGIELYEGSRNIGVRPVWELYELWCFLKMREMIANILELDLANSEQIIETPMAMLEPFSDSNAKHTVQYFASSGDEVKLQYQHTYDRTSGEVHTATTDNRPDIVLTVRKPNGFELTYLYDAKYRVSDDDKLSRMDDDERIALNQRGADYPPSDAINQMHRYRDAIYYGEKQEHNYGFAAKEIIGGYILFPGRGDDESIKQRYYYKSIETVNIGAFPLLPDHRDPLSEGSLLYRHLCKILKTPNVYDHVKDSIPQRGLAYHSEEQSHDSELVLVGYYKLEQIELIKKNKLYYVPAASESGSIVLVSGYEKTKYLLLHNGYERTLLRLTGTGPKFYPKMALEQLGFAPSKEFYLGFEIKNLNPITDIDISKYKFPRGGSASRIPYFATIEEIKRSVISVSEHRSE